MRSFLWAILFAIASVVSLGCGRWPPVVNSKADVARLPANEPSIRARSLPDGEISSLARLTELKRIDFQGGWGSYKAKVTDIGLTELAKLHLSKLEEFDLGRCPRLQTPDLSRSEKSAR